MRKFWIILKWMAVKTRPYLRSLLFILFLSIICSLCTVGMVILSRDLIDNAIQGRWNKVFPAVSFLFGTILMQTGLKAFTSFLSSRTSEIMSDRIRERLYLTLYEADWSEYCKYHSGDIMTRLTKDISSFTGGIVEDLPEAVSLGAGLLASFVTLLVFDPFLAVFTLLIVPAAVLLSQLLGKCFMKVQGKAKDAESIYRSFLQECIEHMLVVKTFLYGTNSAKKLKDLHREKLHWVLKSNLTGAGAGSMFTGSYWISYLVVFGRGALRLSAGTVSFGTFMAFIQLVGQIQQPFMGLAQTTMRLLSAASSSKRLMELENIKREIGSSYKHTETFSNIRLDQVGFGYKEEAAVLNGVSVTVHAGDIIGVVGASGEGKTTLIHLLMSLLNPKAGSIILNSGHNKKYATEAVRSLISYVPQGNSLLSGTISDNLRIGCADASLDEQIDALKKAGAWDFIRQLPDGLLTVIGERGHGLSEGQAQRIAIARALLRKTPILILDEATSALDMETEMQIMQTLLKSKPARTCIFITHRTSMLSYCNRIWRLEAGTIHEIENPAIEATASAAI